MKITMLGFIGFVIVGAAMPAVAAESDYRDVWCRANSGKAEHVLDDRTRVDCLTETHAVEVEFAPKWAEAVGQALFYSAKTGKRPGILIVLKDQSERRFLERLFRVIAGQCLPIEVWTVDG